MAAEILRPRHRLAHNAAGANLVSGVASTLLTAGDADLGLFEVDEAALPELLRRLRPRAVCLGNLFRDQLDRYGELELVAERWRDAVGRLARGDPARLQRRRPAARGGRRGARGRERVRPRRPTGCPPVAATRGRLEVLRPLRHAVHLRGCVRRPPRRLPLPPRRPRPAAAGGGGPGHRPAGAGARLVRARHAGRITPDRAPPARAVQRLQRGRGRRARPRARRGASTRSRTGSDASPRRSGASSASRSAGSASCCC